MTFKLIDRDKLIECLHEKFHAYELDEGISKGIDIAMGVVNEQSLVFARESEKDELIKNLKANIEKMDQLLVERNKQTRELNLALYKACEALSSMCFDCSNCVFSNKGYSQKCKKDITMNPDGSFDCDRPEWWREALLKEVSEDE